MAVAVEVVVPGMSVSQYDALRAEVDWLGQAPVGGLFHGVWLQDGELHGLDVWESAEAFAAFGETRLGPAMAKLGIDAAITPVFHELHEAFAPKAMTITDS